MFLSTKSKNDLEPSILLLFSPGLESREIDEEIKLEKRTHQVKGNK
jgi:hypothetical protein